MKTTIAIIVSIFMYFGFTYAQDNIPKRYNTLYIIKNDTKDIKTNHFLVDSKDIQALDLPSKTLASKTYGTIREQLVIVVTLKKGVTLYTLPMLLEKYKINANDNNLPILIDGESISNQDDIVSTGNMIKSIVKENDHINIISKNPMVKINSLDIKTVH